MNALVTRQLRGGRAAFATRRYAPQFERRLRRGPDMSQKSWIVLSAVVLMLLPPTPLVFAQADRGTIQGRVTDPSNAVLQGASVVITPSGMHTATNTEGEYTINALAPGQYTVTVSFVGFQEFSKTVTVAAGQ